MNKRYGVLISLCLLAQCSSAEDQSDEYKHPLLKNLSTCLNKQLSENSSGYFEQHFNEEGEVVYLATDNVLLEVPVLVVDEDSDSSPAHTLLKELPENFKKNLPSGFYRHKQMKIPEGYGTFDTDVPYHVVKMNHTVGGEHHFIKFLSPISKHVDHEDSCDLDLTDKEMAIRECPKGKGKSGKGWVRQQQRSQAAATSSEGAGTSSTSSQHLGDDSVSGGDGDPPKRPAGEVRKKPQAAPDVTHDDDLSQSLHRLIRARKKVNDVSALKVARYHHLPHIQKVQDALDDPEQREYVNNFKGFNTISGLFSIGGKNAWKSDQPRRYDSPESGSSSGNNSDDEGESDN